MRSLTLQRWLFEAINTKDAEAVRECLERGADVNARDNDMTPLQLAAREGCKEEIVRVLLDAGADVNARNKYGMTPLHLAAYNNHTETIRVLLDAGADVNVKNKDGQTPLHLTGNPETARALLDAGADVNARGKDGYPAAFHVRTPDMVRLLAEYGADFFVKDFKGRLPVLSSLISGFICAWSDYPTALAMLKEMVKQGWDYNTPVGRKGDIFRYYQNKDEARKAKEELEALKKTIDADKAAFEYDYDGYER